MVQELQMMGVLHYLMNLGKQIDQVGLNTHIRLYKKGTPLAAFVYVHLMQIKATNANFQAV